MSSSKLKISFTSLLSVRLVNGDCQWNIDQVVNAILSIAVALKSRIQKSRFAKFQIGQFHSPFNRLMGRFSFSAVFDI